MVKFFKSMTASLALALAVATLGSAPASVAAVTNPIVINGTRLFDSVTGEYFGVRGINYYPRPNTGSLDQNNLDLFTNDFAHIWQRDVPFFVAAGANAIRLYAVEDGDHDEFMCALQKRIEITIGVEQLSGSFRPDARNARNIVCRIASHCLQVDHLFWSDTPFLKHFGD